MIDAAANRTNRALSAAPSTDDVERAATGDADAFALLYADLQPRLLRYAASLVGQDADDVCAEAWLQIARDTSRFSGDLDSFRAWSARIVRNRAMDHLRRSSRRARYDSSVAEVPDLPIPVGDDVAAAAIEARNTARAVALIASLPREQAEAVMLRTIVGLDAGRAGQVLGKSAAAVRVSAHRGLKALAALLAESAEGESS